MAKPDPALLDPARYPFRAVEYPRFGDLDPNAHINNVALASMLEDARVQLIYAFGAGQATRGVATMVVSLSIEYLGQAFCPQPIDVHGAVTHIGRSSYTVSQLVRQEDRTVAYAQATLVCVSGERATALPAEMAAAMRAFGMRG